MAATGCLHCLKPWHMLRPKAMLGYPLHTGYIGFIIACRNEANSNEIER